MRTDVRVAAWAAWGAAWALGTAPVLALDHDNLEAGRPLRIDDAYPIPKGEIGVDVGATVHDRRGDGFGYGLGIGVLYGIGYNAQIEISGDAAFEGSSVAATDRETAAALGVLYNFNSESLQWPAFAVRAEAEATSGFRDTGVDASGGLIVTRTFGRMRTHVNADYLVAASAAAGERRGRYNAAVGASYPLGYPMRFRETLIVDVFTQQSSDTSESNTTGIEMGIRHQISHRIVADAGLGSDVFGPDDRVAWYGMVGVSTGF